MYDDDEMMMMFKEFQEEILCGDGCG